MNVQNNNSHTNSCREYTHETCREDMKLCRLNRECWQIALSLTSPSPSLPVPNSIHPSFRSSLKQQYSSPYSCHLIHGRQLNDQSSLKLEDHNFGTNVCNLLGCDVLRCVFSHCFPFKKSYLTSSLELFCPASTCKKHFVPFKWRFYRMQAHTLCISPRSED